MTEYNLYEVGDKTPTFAFGILEKEVLAGACDIPEERIGQVMEKLCRFCFGHYEELEINGEKRMLYFVRQRYELVAVFAMLNEFLWYSKGFALQACNRSKPYFENR